MSWFKSTTQDEIKSKIIWFLDCQELEQEPDSESGQMSGRNQISSASLALHQTTTSRSIHTVERWSFHSRRCSSESDVVRHVSIAQIAKTAAKPCVVTNVVVTQLCTGHTRRQRTVLCFHNTSAEPTTCRQQNASQSSMSRDITKYFFKEGN